jgi:hypothetical protein
MQICYFDLLSSDLQLINGAHKRPAYNESFPAKMLTTGMNWEDVVLAAASREGVEEVLDWIRFGRDILMLKGLETRLRPGYKHYFTALRVRGEPSLLRCLVKLPAMMCIVLIFRLSYRVMWAKQKRTWPKCLIAPKNKDWILFFDEADALFGKRTDVNSSNDRFANQEVAYLASVDRRP